ncbi:baculoviral IAP repeat-containing protein 7-A-like isoform X2 [Symsagittifera roscoffensis]|uniref:baculoviral IAP repeat-containing protein 7-A-like isoform X2 n=1 Tax=Symsagittifera roscoffensis TaxID=84072 RepID=UPI00307C8DFD
MCLQKEYLSVINLFSTRIYIIYLYYSVIRHINSMNHNSATDQLFISSLLAKSRRQTQGFTKRLASFCQFPQNTSFNSVELAKHGYEFLHEYISCPSCKFRMKPTATDILESHRRIGPTCDVYEAHAKLLAPESLHLHAFSPDQEMRLETEIDTVSNKTSLENSRWKFEYERLKSFADQKTKIPSFEILARSGFYLPENEKVECYACGFSIIAASWQTVFELHAFKSTGCPFLNGKAFNIPVEQQSEPNYSLSEATGDSLQSEGGEHSNNSGDRKAEKSHVEKTKSNPRILDEKFFQRLITYKHWHDVDFKGVSAINCAYAGFVYVHKYAQPVLQCLECEVMMLNSMPAVDMMIEHASCSPVCPFISKVKGVDYFKHAIEIRNIALKKAGKPALNVRAMDVKYALKAEYGKSGLGQGDWESFEHFTTELVNLGFPPKVVQKTVAKKMLKVNNQSSESNERPKLTLTSLLSSVQRAYNNKYLSEEARAAMKPGGESESTENSQTGSGDTSSSSVSSDNSQVGEDWPPTLQLEETLGRCLHCLENPISAQVVDCKHICLCGNCATFVTRCPLCHVKIKATNRLFLVESGSSSKPRTASELTLRLYET